MKIAIISDVHADFHALTDALGQIERLGCDITLCAGDLLDYGLFAEETIELLRDYRIPTVRGNHDRTAVGREAAHEPADADLDAVIDASGWDLSRESLTYLARLPTTWRGTIEGVRVVMTHARPGSDMEGIYPADATPEFVDQILREVDGDVLLIGHTHIAFAAPGCNRGLLANPGALLRDPAAGLDWDEVLLDPVTGMAVRAPTPGGGTFGVLTLPERTFTLHRASDGAEIELQHAR